MAIETKLFDKNLRSHQKRQNKKHSNSRRVDNKTDRKIERRKTTELAEAFRKVFGSHDASNVQFNSNSMSLFTLTSITPNEVLEMMSTFT